MKIYRNGAEIELTKRELMDAAKEYEHICDVDDIICVKDWCENEDEFMQTFGINFAVLDEIKDECAYRYRKYMNESEEWFEASRDAIKDIVSERGIA